MVFSVALIPSCSYGGINSVLSILSCGHAHIDTKRREPWLFGDENTNLIREAIRNRYRLLPTFYALFDENSRLGTPIVRPLFHAFPDDPRVLRKDDCFMLGDTPFRLPSHGIQRFPN